MFERFTGRAREVVVAAQDEARGLGHHSIGTEHLLLGLLRVDDGVAAGVLGGAGLTEAAVRDELVRRIGWGGATQEPADALRAIGIDVDAIREQVERSFGPGALDLPPRHRRRWRRTRCGAMFGPIPFSRRAKKVLELSLREALALRHNHIGTEHILLAILREGEGLAVRMLVDRRLCLDDLRQQILQAIGKVA